MPAANMEQLPLCRGARSDANVRLARRNGLLHGKGSSSSPSSPSSSSSSSSSGGGGDAGGAGGPHVLGPPGRPVNGAEILKNLVAFSRAVIDGPLL
jgi:uncharacterized membrane protein